MAIGDVSKFILNNASGKINAGLDPHKLAIKNMQVKTAIPVMNTMTKNIENSKHHRKSKQAF